MGCDALFCTFIAVIGDVIVQKCENCQRNRLSSRWVDCDDDYAHKAHIIGSICVSPKNVRRGDTYAYIFNCTLRNKKKYFSFGYMPLYRKKIISHKFVSVFSLCVTLNEIVMLLFAPKCQSIASRLLFLSFVFYSFFRSFSPPFSIFRSFAPFCLLFLFFSSFFSFFHLFSSFFTFFLFSTYFRSFSFARSFSRGLFRAVSFYFSFSLPYLNLYHLVSPYLFQTLSQFLRPSPFLSS